MEDELQAQLTAALEAEGFPAASRGRSGSLRRLKGDGPDFASNAAVAAWKQAQGRGAEMIHQEPFDLALAILRRLEDAESLAHIMVEQGGGLRFFTREHIRAQAAKGKVLCKGCGFFFGEGNPMRTHVQNATDTRCFSVEAAEYYLRPCQDDIAAEAHDGSPAGVAQAPAPDPCLEAAQRGDLVALRALVVAGSDATKATDHRGNGVLHWAAGGGHVDVCEYLLHELKMDARARTSKHHGRTALHWAARNGHAAVCALLLDAAGDDFVDAATDGGDTPLMLAAWQGHITCCSILVSRRADVHHTNSWGCNAMHKASRMDGASSSLEMLEYLTHSRVDAGLVNCNGHNSLHKAGAAEDRNAPSALAFAAGFRALAAELRHMEDLLWLTPALYVPLKEAEDYRTTDESVTDSSSATDAERKS
ncbi:Rai14 [Symbiodinium sp. CCMP2456]|nr:Rai14 [Symbiodinium sp. CCMP2456]